MNARELRQIAKRMAYEAIDDVEFLPDHLLLDGLTSIERRDVRRLWRRNVTMAMRAVHPIPRASKVKR